MLHLMILMQASQAFRKEVLKKTQWTKTCQYLYILLEMGFVVLDKNI